MHCDNLELLHLRNIVDRFVSYFNNSHSSVNSTCLTSASAITRLLNTFYVKKFTVDDVMQAINNSKTV